MQALINLAIGFVLALTLAPIAILAFLLLVQSVYTERMRKIARVRYAEQMRRFEIESRER